MFITRTSILTGVTRTRDMEITKEQVQAWESGTLAQDAFPHLDADEREFIMTGITAEEWDSMVSEEGE